MNNFCISAINKSNPLINTYKNTMRNWDEEGNFMKTLEESSLVAIYAVYYNDYFLAASSITINPETGTTNIYTVNGSNTHKQIVDEYMALELPKIVINRFGTEHYTFHNTDKITQKTKTKHL